MSDTETVEKTEEEENEENGNPLLLLTDLLGDPSDKEPLRKIGVIGDIAEENTSDIIYGMLALHDTRFKDKAKDAENPDGETERVSQPFEMIISTNGGDAREMFAIYDMMRFLRKDCDIETMGIGKVMSAGVPLLAAGTKGKRVALPHSRIMIHEPLGGTAQRQASDIEIHAREILDLRKRLNGIYEKHTGKSLKQVEKIMERDTFMTAEDAKSFGLIDEVVTKRPVPDKEV